MSVEDNEWAHVEAGKLKNATKTLAVLLGALSFSAPLAVRAQQDIAYVMHRSQSEIDVKDGESAASSGNWTLAREKFASATQLDAHNMVAFYDLGVALGHMGELEEAAKAERKAIYIDSTYAPAYVELGWVLSRLNDLDGAADAEQKALRLDPANKVAQKNLEAVNAARRNGSRGPAQNQPARLPKNVTARAPGEEQLLITSARTNYTNGQTLQSLLSTGEQAYKTHSLDVAQRTFEQAVLNSPGSSQAHADLGVVLGSKGDIDGQLVEEKRSVALDPTNAAAWTSLGWACSKKQRFNEALSSYQRALTLNPHLIEAQIGQGMALFYSGKKEAGLAAIKQAKAAFPDVAGPSIAVSALLEEEGRNDEAERELRETLKVHADSSETKEQLALLLLQQGKTEEASVLFRDIADKVPGSADAHAGLSLALEVKGDLSGAQQEARKALELNPRLRVAEAALDRLAQRRLIDK